MQIKRSVGIVGGGPGGLTLARLLVTRGIATTVFELDAHALARPQGGSLDLHAESGQRALRKAGLEAPFQALARYDDQYDALYDPQGVRHFEHSGTSGASGASGDRPEIDRTQLRQLLLDSLPEGVIRWGSKVTGAAPSADGRCRVLGEQGALGTFDLVVGADGLAHGFFRGPVSFRQEILGGNLKLALRLLQESLPLDPDACTDFELITKSPAWCTDLSSITPAALKARWGERRPDAIFTISTRPNDGKRGDWVPPDYLPIFDTLHAALANPA